MKRFVLLIVAGLLAAMETVAAAPAKHVVLIGVDGLGAYGLRKIEKARIPNLCNIMEGGAWTLKDRSVLASSSAINWASMFTGLPTELHGYTKWNSAKPEIKPNLVNERGVSPTIFSEIRRQRPNARTEVIAEWNGIGALIDKPAVDRYFLIPGKYEDHPQMIIDEAVRAIKERKPALLAVCIDQIDHIGPRIGHDTPAYYDGIAALDGYVGRILKAVQDAGIVKDTVIILTADHGGTKKGHGGISPAEMEIPFLIYGAPLKTKGEIPVQMMQYDCAAVIADALGIAPNANWRGRTVPGLFRH